MKINHITPKLLIPLVACIVLSACNGSSSKAAAEGAFVDYISVSTDIPDLQQDADTNTKISLNEKNDGIRNDPTGKQYKVDISAIDGNKNPTNDLIGIPSSVTLTKGTEETKEIAIHGKQVGFGKIVFKVTRDGRTVDQKAYTVFKVVAKKS